MSENRVTIENPGEVEKKVLYTVRAPFHTIPLTLPTNSRALILPKSEEEEMHIQMDPTLLIFQPQIPNFVLETLATSHTVQQEEVEEKVQVKEEQNLPPPSSTSFYCSLCNKKFTRQSNLTEHLSRHNGEVFQCHLCQKAFSCNRYLVRHLRIHKYDGAKSERKTAKPKTYACSYCEKKFTCKSHVVAHTRLHTGDRPFVCLVCKKRFNYKSRLTTHNRVHTGEKPFSCRVCKKKFRDASNLAGHVKVHGVKAFECEFCHEQFSNRTELKMHEKGISKKNSLLSLDGRCRGRPPVDVPNS